MDKTLSYRFERLIAARTGLQLRTRERDALHGLLTTRMAALHLRHAEEYHTLLQTAGTREAESEWDQLIGRLTNQESYFFRDKGQMALLRERILPELIARNQPRRTLRLWSAGCSTGEEAYSLAMLVDELLPQRGAASGSRWDIVILGTDIDEQALGQARRGIYGAWSFRTVEPAVKQRCFHRREGGWQVAESSRSLVTFRRCNLVGDPFPDMATGLHDMDLILCRNVFIYFEREAVSAVLLKFAQTLRDGGFLMTGHTETYGQTAEPLQARMFPESVLYERVPRASADPGPTPEVKAIARQATVRNQAVREAQVRRPSPVEPQIASPRAAPPATPESAPVGTAAHYVAVEDLSTVQAPREPVGDNALLLQARTYANLGHYEEATTCCRRLMEEFPFSSEPYELLAAIAQEQERYDEAKLLLKKALYLAPESPRAYLELSALYRSEGDIARARKMQFTALDLLRQLPPEDAVGSAGGPNAHAWTLHLNQLLAEGE